MKRGGPMKRRKGMTRGKPLARKTELRATARPVRRVPFRAKVTAPPAAPAAPALKTVRAQQRKAAARPRGITARTCRLVDDRDSLDGVRMCVHCGSPRNLHRHHRRFRSHPGPHRHCACNVVTVCQPCHHWAHEMDRREAEAEGLILSAEVARPWLHSVLVHGPAGDGGQFWPTCAGEWQDYAPEGIAA